MADTLELKIVLDNGDVVKGFVDIEKQAKTTETKISNNLDDSFGGAIQSIRAFAGEFAAVGVVAVGLKKTLDFALLGEQVKAIETNFTKLADSAGLASGALKDSIIEATKGLIDDEEALQIATKSIVSLGKEASKIPEILNLSRNASKALGKDFKETFENLSGFVENGNARILRQYGLTLDVERALTKYAGSIGLTASELTKAQEQQARINLLLEVGTKKFEDNARSITPLKDSIDRLKVSLGNLNESFGTFVNNNYSDGIAQLADRFNLFIKSFSNDPADRVAILNAEIEKTQLIVSELTSAKLQREGKGFFDSLIVALDGNGALPIVNLRLAESKTKLAALNSELKSLTKTADAAIKPDAAANKQSPPAFGLTDDQLKAIQNRSRQLSEFIRTNDEQALASRLDQISKLKNADEIYSQTKEVFAQKDILLNEEKISKIQAAEQQFSLKNGFNDAQRLNAKLSIEQAYNQKILQNKIDSDKKLIDLQANTNTTILGGFQTFSAGFSEAAADFSSKAGQSFKDVGKNAFNTLGRGVGQAFAAFGESLAKGEDASKAFLKALIGVFADIAIQLGTSYILQGIALSANPLTPGAGGPLIAAGAALATFGGLLKAFSGGGGASTSAATDTGGGIASSPTTSTDLSPTQKQEPNTQVQVVVQGSVYDSDETGSRIVDLINSAFDKKGVVINQGAMA